MLTFINRLSQLTGLGVMKKHFVEIAIHSRCSFQSYGTRLVHCRGLSAENFVPRYLTQTPDHNHLKTPYSTASGNQVNTLCGQRPHSQYRLVHRRCTAGAFSQ